MKRDFWNKCDECGKFISYEDIEKGFAIRDMITPHSDVSYESWLTLCCTHYNEYRKLKAKESSQT